MSQGKDSSVPRYSFPPERGPAIQRCEVNKYRPLPTMPLNRKKKTKNKKNIQGCSFKMVRWELPEFTQRHGCSQDGEEEGEGGKGRKEENKDVPSMWKGTDSCFSASSATL